MDEDAIELVGSVGPLDAVVVALREFLHRSGAVRAVAVVDREPGEGPAVVDCARLAPIEVDFGDRVVHLPHAIELDADAAAAARRAPAPALRSRRRDGARSRRRSAASPTWPAPCATSRRRSAGATWPWPSSRPTIPHAPLAITARADGSEPIVLALGDEEFPMDPGWP